MYIVIMYLLESKGTIRVWVLLQNEKQLIVFDKWQSVNIVQ